MNTGRPSPAAHSTVDAAARETLLRAPFGICHLGDDDAIAFANPALALMLGFRSTNDLVATRRGSTLFHEDSPAASVEALGAGRLSFEGAEALLAGRDGAPVLASIDGTRFTADGGGGGWILYFREAAKEKERETELARTLAELENTIQTIPDILYTLDVEARLVRWNRKLETATGWSAEELRDRPGFELFPETEKRTFAKAIMDAFATGYAEFETRLLARDGRTIPYQWTAVPLEDATGKVIGLAGAGRDFSEWKRNEEARAHLEELIRNRAREWQLTFDAIESPIVIADAEGRLVRLNRAARDLIAADIPFRELVGRNLAEFADREPWNAFLQLSTSPTESPSGDAYDAFTQKTWHVARAGLGSIGRTDVEGDVSILIGRDITRMLELQETARKNQVMSAVGQLIVGVAHEVRNPIFGISATLDAFEASFAVDEDSRQFFEVLRGEIGRLSELMQELLDYGRPARMELHDGRLADVVAEAVRACDRSAERAQVRIANQVPPDLPLVPIDRSRLAQVFQNLIENAVQFSPAGGAVTIVAEVAEDDGRPAIAASVLDQGKGFPPGDLDRIFEPFFTRRRGGTGLGLSIVHRIVDEHGGTIEAANRPEGGARMTVFLPISESGPNGG
ncbi:MAG: ATP-binding protein [Thermoanaerobaculia bacterium]